MSITSGEIGFNNDDVITEMSGERLMLQMGERLYERNSAEQLQL